MIYRNVLSAVVRALASEVINSSGGCDFEPKVQSARVPGKIYGKELEFLIDCWINRRLGKAMPEELWDILIAKYSSHIDRKHEAMLRVAARIKSPAPKRFVECAVVTWAHPKRSGVDGKRSNSVLPDSWYDIDRWGGDSRPASTLYRWRSSIAQELNSQAEYALIEAQEVLDAEGLIKDAA